MPSRPTAAPACPGTSPSPRSTPRHACCGSPTAPTRSTASAWPAASCARTCPAEQRRRAATGGNASARTERRKERPDGSTGAGPLRGRRRRGHGHARFPVQPQRPLQRAARPARRRAGTGRRGRGGAGGGPDRCRPGLLLRRRPGRAAHAQPGRARRRRLPPARGAAAAVALAQAGDLPCQRRRQGRRHRPDRGVRHRGRAGACQLRLLRGAGGRGAGDHRGHLPAEAGAARRRRVPAHRRGVRRPAGGRDRAAEPGGARRRPRRRGGSLRRAAAPRRPRGARPYQGDAARAARARLRRRPRTHAAALPRALRLGRGARGDARLRRETRAELGSSPVRAPLRIANCSGFYGDRLSAAREMVEGGPIDVLTGDYLAELTMGILWKARAKDPDAGYATSFLAQWEQVATAVAERGVKVVVNAGGLNPAGLAQAVRAVATRLGLAVRVAHLDDGRPLAGQPLPPVAANAYLGCFGIAEALAAGADVVVCGRVTDAALTMGPAAWHHRWAREDFDALAGALVAGHVIECGAQATGGNYAFFAEVPDLVAPGFPIAEVAADGGAVITKHAAHGGLVSVGTVTAQLLYEVAGPRYASPDVVARLDSVRLEPDGPDRVRISGVRGEPPPPTTKVAVVLPGGWRNTVGFLLTGLDVEAKAALVERALWPRLGGREAFARSDVRLLGGDRPDPASPEEALSELRVTVMDPYPAKVGRRFSAACVELGLASYPGFTLTAPPGRETAFAVYWPTLVPNEVVPHRVVHHDGGSSTVAPAPLVAALDLDAPGAPLGRLAGARSGDKGGNANLGVWARDQAGYAWLEGSLTVERLRSLLPETAGLEVRRYTFPNLLALNFVIAGLLGDGVASSTRPDPQAKGLGEQLRARLVDLPVALLEPAAG